MASYIVIFQNQGTSSRTLEVQRIQHFCVLSFLKICRQKVEFFHFFKGLLFPTGLFYENGTP